MGMSLFLPLLNSGKGSSLMVWLVLCCCSWWPGIVALLVLVLFNMVTVKMLLGNTLLSDGSRIKHAGKFYDGWALSGGAIEWASACCRR